ncbi:MAG: GNAT family N-acetyltransferase [Oscillospiraceae bacterium]|nr:GNAT family N-acetyltransferase [Oscillospiraceae bacterium]
MKRHEILREAKKQLAVDLNGAPADFDHPETQFRPIADLPGRRPFHRGEPAFEMATFGRGSVISASSDLLPRLRRELAKLDRDALWSQPFLRSIGHYFLPDPDALRKLPFPPGIRLEWAGVENMAELYRFEGFSNALGYDLAAPRPDVLAVSAWEGERLVGMAGASADCNMLWQVGVDVLPDWRGKGLGSAMVSALSLAVLENGKIPYYGTSSSNLASQRTACRVGFYPAWVCSYGVVFLEK